MRNIIAGILLAGLWLPCPGAVIAIFGKADPALHQTIVKGMEFLYKENFSAGFSTFEKVIDKYPGHPVGYFLLAAAIDAKMFFYYTAEMESDFMKYCEKAVEVGEKAQAAHPDDLWIQFFTGGAYGYMGTFQARYRLYLTAFRNGWTGVSMLKQIYEKDSTFVDVLYGLGTYYYWSSRLSKAIWWMPGLGDKRALGISQLRKAVDEGCYTGLPASATLVRIFIEEKRYGEAENLAKRMLRQYPGNRNFSFDLAEIYFLTGRYDESEKLYTTILDQSDAEAFNNNINSLRCRTFLAKIYEKKKVYYKALAECRRALQYIYNQTDKIVAKEYMAEVRTVMKNVEKVYKIVR